MNIYAKPPKDARLVYGGLTICVLRKNHSTQIRITLEEWKGSVKCHVREFYPGQLPDQWHPGKGACLDVSLLPELAAGIAQAEAKARELGLLNSEEPRT